MKFVALTLALLLAVGSQAASLQADAPSQLEHARVVMDLYLTQVKESAKKALDQLDDTEYKTLKESMSLRLDDLHAQIKVLQGAVSPVTDSVVSTIVDATADFQASVINDINTLKAELEPKRLELKEVLENHIADYRLQLEPIIKEYFEKHTTEMEALKIRLEPIVEQMRAKVATNVEETKAVLMPMVESVRSKLTERLDSLRQIVSPYVDEYKEQLKKAYGQAQSISPEDIQALKDKVTPMAEDIKVQLTSIFEAVSALFNKS
ncbi:Apolipoprotein AI isoform 6 [Scophthalmus maximus]|nr:apolipoprotein A-I isoform X2 [Scophthalmus maximus]AWO99325.1 Apolipoprotein AI [Scophthalmus maximus]AWO99327.1 Apolipoprotein AI isoform 3 [Scophthalmus maximus]AWO99328.1 Apolipoprotein AI isoform 4 [Scophthalmus maximus]AWO99329.1 Apolipoprotein AI isoform 5 [Scophthalmus maximus]AWO99330.1 Apolipoprotein AI isoform 6 [Scophthalmus maximus]